MASILVIDDDEAVCRLIRVLLEGAGYSVREAAGGAEGVALYRQAAADLVLCDLGMPRQNGIETLRQLRQEFPEVRVVLTSGGSVEATPQSLEEVKHLGALALLAKPIPVPLLVRTVKAALGESSTDEHPAREHAEKQKPSGFSGCCPRCHGYNSRIRSELINYEDNETPQAIASRTRVFLCNACQHIWSETAEQ